MKADYRTYNAKSANEHHGEISNREHLQRVGELARAFGAEIGKETAAGLAGDFHDFGKYAERFQGVLRGTHQAVDHAMPAAAELYRRIGSLSAEGISILESVAGHHNGLTSFRQMQDGLEDMLCDETWDDCPSGKMPSLCGEEEFTQAEQAFERDFPNYTLPKLKRKRCATGGSVENMLDTRMLFSCLVDADYSVSASDDDPDYLNKHNRAPLDAAAMLKKLEEHCARIREGSTADAGINALRNEVYARCGEAAEQPMGLFTLTAPTGVGKTLAMLNFALRHCQLHGLRRIIVVLPFLSIAEQTEKEYLNIFPEILVDHSQKDLSEEARILAERWDSPVIITTSVRFFESLFSANPRSCRKLHNIANSVLLFDEAQSLPAALARPTTAAVNALCEHYHCSMLFSTATQPDFSALPEATWQPREILPDNARFFRKMRRVNAKWCHDASLEQIAEQMSSEQNVCCIVNLRRHARKLFELISERAEERDAVFLLTTDLCPGHRLTVVEEIIRRQKNAERCIVVATQCIEAGVDLDFDTMFRTMAPLEAIVQAAGRCNRNGKISGGGSLYVFRPLEEGCLYPGDSYERAASLVTNLWSETDTPELSDPEQIREYYKRYFTGEKGDIWLQEALRKKDYVETARYYKLIKNAGVSLIVPWSGEHELFQKVCDAERKGSVSQALLREAAPITISCFDEETVRACATPLFLRRGKLAVETGTFILNKGFEDRYDPVRGFSADDNMHENYMT